MFRRPVSLTLVQRLVPWQQLTSVPARLVTRHQILEARLGGYGPNLYGEDEAFLMKGHRQGPQGFSDIGVPARRDLPVRPLRRAHGPAQHRQPAHVILHQAL
jgi:hypothetical protein